MPRIRYKVTLTGEERDRLREMSTRGKHSSQSVLNALILLGCDEGPFQERKLTAEEIAKLFDPPFRSSKVIQTSPARIGSILTNLGVEKQSAELRRVAMEA